MPAEKRDLWHELGVIVAIYLGCVILYSIAMWYIYGQDLGGIEELLKQIPKFLKKDMGVHDKLELVVLATSVVLYTLPLAISCAFIAFNARAGALSIANVSLCVVIPFVLYYLIFDPNVVASQFHGGWLGTVFAILSYYVLTFKIVTVGSVLIGGWAGYRFHEVVE